MTIKQGAGISGIEVEFSSLEQSEIFCAEVTQDDGYKNAALAVHGMPDSYAKRMITI